MKEYTIQTVVGVFVVIGLICVGYMTIHLGKSSFFADDYYSLYARFSSVSGLKSGGPVEVNGIEVGKVQKLALDKDKQLALVELKIPKGLAVYDDAIATIKTSGLIGDKFVKIDPGGGGELLKPGGTITETTSPTDIEELISKYAFGDVTGKKKDEPK